MFKLHEGNVLLKRSHRRQILGWLRRVMKIGHRLGRFVLDLRLSRTGRIYEARGTVRDAAGDFSCHCRGHDWRDTVRELARCLAVRLHAQLLLSRAAATAI
jgi:hypothetical protein